MKDIDFEIFKIKHNNSNPEKGNVLISEPFSRDLYFKRSVVLLTEHSQDGSVGFILNKPVEYSLNELLVDFPAFDAPVSLGGPVKTDSIQFIHTLGIKLPGSLKIFGSIYWGGEFEALKNMIIAGLVSKNQVRFFVGYSGWSPNQLLTEIKNDYWLVSEIDPEIIMNVDHDIWKDSLKVMGKKYEVWSNFPENPKMN